MQPPPDPSKPVQPAPVSPPKPYGLDEYLKNPMVLGGAAAGVLAVAAGLWLLLRKSKKRRAKAGMTKAVEGAGKGEIGPPEVDPLKQKLEAKLAERAALDAAEEQEQLEALNAAKLPSAHSKKAEVLCKHIGEEVKRDPLLVAQVVRAWMNEREH
jgi:flagellar biosynthesis/type III secretory pathway M-ring protein FliF/YscJ